MEAARLMGAPMRRRVREVALPLARPAVAAGIALARIFYPAPGSIIALDPDIPPERQRIPLKLSGPAQAGWI